MLRKAKRVPHAIADSALFKVTTKRKLSTILLCSPDKLREVGHLGVKYKNRWKRKDSDTAPWLKAPPPPGEEALYRPIDIPVPELKSLQSRIAGLLSRILTPGYLFSPVKGVSYVNNAARHRGGRNFWLLDIADYFPSCSSDRVAWFFATVMKCAPDVTAILVQLTTDNGRLPQGSPCSPILAFFSNMKMWDEIAALVESRDCVLSVYADDITISGSNVPGDLIWSVKQCIHKNGFKLKRSKELSLCNSAADITGVIVRDGRLLLPNRQFKKLKELTVKKRTEKNGKALSALNNQIQGRIAQRRQIENF